MLKNYIKITFRNLVKNKSHSLINIGGLTIGIISALVIFLVTRFDLSFDTYHSNYDHIYRVVRASTQFGELERNVGVPYPLPEAIRNEIPGIGALTITDSNYGTPVLSAIQQDGDISRFKQENTVFLQPDYFEIFDYRWQAGDPSALERPNTVVITTSLAEKLFGNENPMGKTLTLQTGNKYDLEVTGVVQDPPPNTDLPFVLFASFSSADRDGNRRDGDLGEDWGSVSSSVQCYLMLEEGVEPGATERQLESIIEKYRDKEIAETLNYLLQPMSELHFDTWFGNYAGRTASKESLLALGLIGLFLLITAGINFINLNTAVAVKRSKEVGVRKVLGGTRMQLALHFLGETALIVLASLIIAVGLTEFVVGYLSSVLGFVLEFNLWASPGAMMFTAGLFIALTLAAGVYPALYLSGFSPMQAIRNRITASYGEKITLRRSLVVVQFAISQALIICTLVIGYQMSYVQSTNMGFVKEAIVEVPIPLREEVKLERFKNALSGQSSIRQMAYSNTGTAHSNVWGGNYKLKGDEEMKEGGAQVKYVEPEFVDVYGLEIVAGSNLTPSDTVSQYLVNETFARETGYGDDYNGLIGSQVEIWGRPAPIVGVVKDFNTMSLREKLSPVLIAVRDIYMQAGIKINMSQSREALEVIEEAFNATFPEYVFEYMFLDERIRDFYEEEQRTAQLMNLFTIVAILIGCLGLFGLVSYMAASRTKEIGVRKVLGATVAHILGLFSKEFLLLVGISFLIAGPAAWFIMQRWLSNYAYRIDLELEIFAAAFAITLLVVVFTVGLKSLKAAWANPVESLKSE